MPQSPARRNLLGTVLPQLFGLPTQNIINVISASVLQGAPHGAVTLIEDQDSLRIRARPPKGGHMITEPWLRSLGDSECLWRFRLTAEQLINLTNALRLPYWIQTNRFGCRNVEALSLVLARFRSAGDQYELSMLYRRSQPAISEIINWTVQFLDEVWKHLLDWDAEYLLHPEQLQYYADAIHKAGAPIKTVFGWPDCTLRHICRPTFGQRAAYSGYKRYHSLKFQAVTLPNGMVAHLFGPVEGRRHDLLLWNESGIPAKLAEFATQPGSSPDDPHDKQCFQLYGDAAYGIGPNILSPFSGPGHRTPAEAAWNVAMGSVRIGVEHGFGTVVNTFPFLNAFWKMKVFSSPVGRYYRVGVLLANGINCFFPNLISQRFECRPPTIDEYFHL